MTSLVARLAGSTAALSGAVDKAAVLLNTFGGQRASLLFRLSLSVWCRVSMRVYTADDWQVIETIPPT
jgi:hypothetical protein